jgi:hypothetical protein
MTLVTALTSVMVMRDSRAAFDAHRLRTGPFLYVDQGRQGDRGQLTIRRLASPDRYEFSANITGAANQRWTSVATPTFDPISATITFGPDTVGNEPRFMLAYHEGRVTGFVTHGSRSIDTVVPDGVVDQRIDWAAVMASDLAPGREFHFAVYDPSIGVSAVHATVGAVARVTVPGGTFDVYPVTYRIAKATGTAQYQVLVTREIPRMLVREIFPDGVVTDLVTY